MLTGTWKYSNVFAFAFTLFVFYVTPRVDLYPISPCRNHGRPIIKKLWNIRAVDYANNITIFITIYDWFVIFDFVVCSFVNQLFIVIHQTSLWWTWRDSNPRPERLTLRLVQQFFKLLTFLCSSHCGFTDTFFCDWTCHNKLLCYINYTISFE